MFPVYDREITKVIGYDRCLKCKQSGAIQEIWSTLLNITFFAPAILPVSVIADEISKYNNWRRNYGS